jgi:hypothetical protein
LLGHFGKSHLQRNPVDKEEPEEQEDENKGSGETLWMKGEWVTSGGEGTGCLSCG